jgi:hypothetical protein
VLDHLAHVAQGAGVVPAELLRTGPTAVSQRWRAAFDREVVEDARRRGLCVRRWAPLVIGRAQRATDLGRAAARYWYRQAPQGATVRMVVTPLLAHVRRIEVLRANPQADGVLGAGEVASAPPLAPFAADAAGASAVA